MTNVCALLASCDFREIWRLQGGLEVGAKEATAQAGARWYRLLQRAVRSAPSDLSDEVVARDSFVPDVHKSRITYQVAHRCCLSTTWILAGCHLGTTWWASWVQPGFHIGTKYFISFPPSIQLAQA